MPAVELEYMPRENLRGPLGDPFCPVAFHHHPRDLVHLEAPFHPRIEALGKILGPPPPTVDDFIRQPPALRPPPPLLAVANPQLHGKLLLALLLAAQHRVVP